MESSGGEKTPKKRRGRYGEGGEGQHPFLKREALAQKRRPKKREEGAIEKPGDVQQDDTIEPAWKEAVRRAYAHDESGTPMSPEQEKADAAAIFGAIADLRKLYERRGMSSVEIQQEINRFGFDEEALQAGKIVFLPVRVKKSKS